MKPTCKKTGIPSEAADEKLGDRPMVGHAALDRGIGVRIPVSQFSPSL